MCVKAILITIIKIKRTAGEDPFQAHCAHLALWGWGRWEVGRRERLSLAWASAFQRRLLKMTVPGACGLLRTPLYFHTCTYSHSVSYLKAFIHLFNKCLLSIYHVPGTVLDAETQQVIKLNEKQSKEGKQNKATKTKTLSPCTSHSIAQDRQEIR